MGARLRHAIAAAGGTDRVDVFAGITEDQLSFARSGDNLEMTVVGQTDKLIVSNWYVSSGNQIEEFRLSDGNSVLASVVQALVNAMAAFSARDTQHSIFDHVDGPRVADSGKSLSSRVKHGTPQRHRHHDG